MVGVGWYDMFCFVCVWLFVVICCYLLVMVGLLVLLWWLWCFLVYMWNWFMYR